MARIKRTFTQRDFSQMVVREDLLERDDTEVRKRSLKGGRNLRALASGGIEARWGSRLISRVSVSYQQMFEIEPAEGQKFLLLLGGVRLTVLNESGAEVFFSFIGSLSNPAERFWVQPFGATTVIGAQTFRPRVLTYNGSSFSIADFSWASAGGGEEAQPYWSYRPGSRISASARTGTVTLLYYPTPDSLVPAPLPPEIGSFGGRIRYHGREIGIVNSSTGTIINSLPPSFDVTVASGTQFLPGQVVIGNDSGWQGYVSEKASNVLRCATLRGYDGPSVNETLSGPEGSSEVTARSVRTDALASPVWDEPLMSSYNGWPGAAKSVAGRLAFLNFPNAKDVIAVSSARGLNDFKVGQEDDDAIVRAIGDNAPRLLHAVNVGDLVILTDKGCYNIPTRENGVLTPSTFNPVKFDSRGAHPVPPAPVDDGVVFLDASGTKLMAALLDGNVYLKWSVRDLSVLAPDMISNPVALCGPVTDDPNPERYVLVVNADGEIIAASWQDAVGPESVGFCEWVTSGSYRGAAPALGSYWTLVDRSGTRCLERFDPSIYVDGAVLNNGGTLDLSHIGANSIYGYTTSTVSALTGSSFGPVSQADLPSRPLTVTQQLGSFIGASAEFWPEEVIDSGRNGTFDARTITFGVSVQDTRHISLRANRTTRNMGGYSFGDDLGAAPPLRTTRFLMPVFGKRTHPELLAFQDRPGEWRILAAIQEAQA